MLQPLLMVVRALTIVLTLIDNDQFINLNDITGFEVLKGAVGNNILQGSNTVNTWIINQNNEGTVK